MWWPSSGCRPGICCWAISGWPRRRRWAPMRCGTVTWGACGGGWGRGWAAWSWSGCSWALPWWSADTAAGWRAGAGGSRRLWGGGGLGGGGGAAGGAGQAARGAKYHEMAPNVVYDDPGPILQRLGRDRGRYVSIARDAGRPPAEPGRGRAHRALATPSG